MRKNLFVLFLLFSFLVPQTALAVDGSKNGEKRNVVKISKAEKEMAESIKADRLRDFLTFISSDAMGGRNTPSRGLDITADFIAFHLKQWGFKPAGDDGTFFQKMTIKSNSLLKAKMTFGEMTLARGKDFVNARGGSIPESAVVFAGNGWMVKGKNIDAYRGVDVKDKIVVLYSEKASRGIAPSMPDGVTQADLSGTKGVDWADPLAYAESKGARGVIIALRPAQDRFVGQLARRGGRGSVEGLGRGSGGGAGSGAAAKQPLPIVLVKSATAKKMMADVDGGLNVTKAVELKDKAMLDIDAKSSSQTAQNVVAIWEGGDPMLKKEMVAVGAHYDHVGINENARGEDKIFNGADDDGSGTTAVLAIAEALAKAKKRPKRSVLLVWHAGEEKGLWGSEYFNKYPTVDIKNVVAQLNIDMIGRSKAPGDTNPRNKDLSGPNEVYLIGSEMMSSTLGAVTKGTNTAYKNMNYNLKYDDPKDTNRFFFRSDHFNYAVNGIPVAFWFTGVHEDYHQPGDEVEKIDFNKMETITRTIFLTMWELSELKERPAVDKELPPELQRRN